MSLERRLVSPAAAGPVATNNANTNRLSQPYKLLPLIKRKEKKQRDGFPIGSLEELYEASHGGIEWVGERES